MAMVSPVKNDYIGFASPPAEATFSNSPSVAPGNISLRAPGNEANSENDGARTARTPAPGKEEVATHAGRLSRPFAFPRSHSSCGYTRGFSLRITTFMPIGTSTGEPKCSCVPSALLPPLLDVALTSTMLGAPTVT